jgi:hypothetical protein
MYDAALPDRGVTVRRWLSRPVGRLAGLVFLPDATRGSARRRFAGRERVSRRNQAPATRGVADGAGGRLSRG